MPSGPHRQSHQDATPPDQQMASTPTDDSGAAEKRQQVPEDELQSGDEGTISFTNPKSIEASCLIPCILDRRGPIYQGVDQLSPH